MIPTKVNRLRTRGARTRSRRVETRLDAGSQATGLPLAKYYPELSDAVLPCATQMLAEVLHQ